MTKERWKDVPDYEGRYSVSDRGRVRSLPRTITDKTGRPRFLRGKILKPILWEGYLSANLNKQGKSQRFGIHRLVLLAFVGPCPDSMECRHFPDRDRSNNKLENLQWGTPKENQHDRIEHGTAATFEQCRKGGLLGGRKGGLASQAAMTPKQRKELTRKIIRKTKARWAAMTAEDRIAQVRKAGLASMVAKTPEQRSKLARKAALARWALKEARRLP